jgi:phosphoenolpyruvate-protein phosphotransferase (PTS system enzyme I)
MEELHLTGSSVSEGVAIGTLCFIEERKKKSFPDFAIKKSEVHTEISRYRTAISSSRRDLEKLQNFLCKEGSDEAVSIIDSHIQMLEDPLMTTVMEDQIKGMLRNTETVFNSVMSGYEDQFSKIDDAFFQQRLVDVKDLSARILNHLTDEVKPEKTIPKLGIVCAKELIPSDTAEAPIGHVGAFISEMGGMTSHAALIARAKGIPYVAHVDFDTLRDFGEVTAIIDGKKGLVILNPSRETLNHYQKLQRQIAKEELVLRQEVSLNTSTLDGCRIEVSANLDNLVDVNNIHADRPASIGLFRTENLFFKRDLIDTDEEEQYSLYSEAVKRAQGLCITFRTFDVGSDKNVLRELWSTEPNPALGCRALRYLLQQPDLFKIQLRALARASKHGPIRILFPLICEVQELIDAKKLFLEAKKEAGIIADIPCGAMIEVPSAVLTCDAIAKRCDFLALGTNDLIQYTLAIDRCNPRLIDFYKPIHPGVVKMIVMAVNAAARQSTPISLCGEIASDARLLPLLIGLGITSFSCSPRYIPLVKRTVRETSFHSAQSLANQVLTLDSSSQVEDRLHEYELRA